MIWFRRGRVRTMQVIAGALLLGLISLAAMSLFVVGMVAMLRKARPSAGFVLSWLSIAVFLGALPVSFLVPRLLEQQAVNDLAQGKPIQGLAANMPVSEQLLARWQGTAIVSVAILEGAGFFAVLRVHHRTQGRVVGYDGRGSRRDVSAVSDGGGGPVVAHASSRIARTLPQR